jgi:hypothetical protein
MSAQLPSVLATAEGCRQYLAGMAHLGHVPSVFMMKLGRAWAPQALPVSVPRGPQRRCYENAGTLAIERPELTYVEGYAAAPGSIIPVNHAWCVDAEGRVVDNTFVEPENSQYLGVAISSTTLRALVMENGHWGLFAEHMTPTLLDTCLADLQAGAWPAEGAAAAEVRDLLRPFLAD